MADTIISARDLDFYYGETHALKNICLDIPEHNITALIGPSGCGKSIMIKTKAAAIVRGLCLYKNFTAVW